MQATLLLVAIAALFTPGESTTPAIVVAPPVAATSTPIQRNGYTYPSSNMYAQPTAFTSLYGYSAAPNYYPVSNSLLAPQQPYAWMTPQQQPQQSFPDQSYQQQQQQENNILAMQSQEIEKELAFLSSGKPPVTTLKGQPSQPPAMNSPSGGFSVPNFGALTATTGGTRNRPVAVIPKHTSGAHKDEAPDTHEATKGASESHGHSHFGYREGEGPETWPKHYPMCAGRSQSPIDIRQTVLEPRSLPHLIREHLWAQPDSMVVENNGHTLELDGHWQKDKYPTIRGGPLLDTYEFKQAHFHWGRTDYEGSEHTVDGHRMPMEIHMVHWNQKHGSYEKAVTKPDGLAVLGAFFEVTSTNNSMIDVLLPYLNSVGGSEARGVHMRDPTPIGILPVDLKHYITYQGSLTTPPCSEVVTWIVSTTPLTLSEKQMAFMRNIVEDDHGLIHNFRAPQPLHGRKVFLNSNVG